MKKSVIFFVLTAIAFSETIMAQRQDTLIFTEKYKEYIKKIHAIKSNLIYTDSVKLLSTFSTDEGIRKFIETHKDSNNFSFISTFRFDFMNERLVLRKNKFSLNPYERAFYNYVKNKFINFKFKEKRTTNNKYRIITYWMFDSDEKEIVIKIIDFTQNELVTLFKATIPYKGPAFSDVSLSSPPKNE